MNILDQVDLALVVDTTGSLGSCIGGARTQVTPMLRPLADNVGQEVVRHAGAVHRRSVLRAGTGSTGDRHPEGTAERGIRESVIRSAGAGCVPAWAGVVGGRRQQRPVRWSRPGRRQSRSS